MMHIRRQGDYNIMRLKNYLQESDFVGDLQLDESGNFEYMSAMDADNHRTIKGLMKNNGIFKSMKQRWYLLEKQWAFNKIGASRGKGDAKIDAIIMKPSELKTMRGISTEASIGDYFVEVNAAMIFGKRGAGQGFRRVEWGYLIDDVGVREEYKYGFEYYDGGSGSQMDKSKTKRLWKRKEDQSVQDFRDQVAQEEMAKDAKEKAGAAELKKSEWLGVIGERMKGIEVEVLRKHFFETQYGESSITVMKDSEGNMIQHFGRNRLKKGDKKKVDFTVKGHEKAEINKWNKVPYKYTAVNRVK